MELCNCSNFHAGFPIILAVIPTLLDLTNGDDTGNDIVMQRAGSLSL